MTVGTLACVYIILACSLNLSGGYHGTLSLCQAAFYGLGAYAYGISTVRFSVEPGLALVLAALVAAIGGVVVALPSLRLRGDYFLIATLGLGEVFNAFLLNARSVTGGPSGVSGIPPLFSVTSTASLNGVYLAVAATAMAIVVGLCIALERSPYGQVMYGLADDEIGSMALGRDPVAVRMNAVTLGAATAGIAGALYASYVSSINPTLFTTAASLLVLSMAIIGGMGRAVGAVVGALLLSLLPEALRFAKVPGPQTQLWQQVFLGVALMALMAWRPSGVAIRRG